MIWEKLGLFYGPDGSLSWAMTHAYCPTYYKKKDGTTRIYFSSWDINQRGSIGYIDINFRNDFPKINKISKNPVLSPGLPGSFDCDGVAPSQLIEIDGILYMYYFGFQRTTCNNVTLIFAGVAKSFDDGDTFQKIYNYPVLDRTNTETFFRSSLFLLKNKYKNILVYTASVDSPKHINSNLYNDKTFPSYTLKCLNPTNHLSFDSPSTTIRSLKNDEFGICRPWITYYGSYLKMWYSVRSLSTNYRIGCLSSIDGVEWQDENPGISTSTEGWDSEMICFASVGAIDNKLYMFYNGNKHGYDGFGIAINKL